MKREGILKIQYIGDSETAEFTAKECKRYLSAMDPMVEYAVMKRVAYDPQVKNTLWIGQDKFFETKLPQVEDPKLDDGIYIDFKNGAGIISGTNDRSLLIGVYRFLRELGCAWVYPGKAGERIPRIKLAGAMVSVCEAASYRHRNICIEGACSYDHVLAMIDWLPKIGMNGYFNEFFVPYTHFDRWYSHRNNPLLYPHNLTVEEVEGIVQDHIKEIKKRGMFYHAVGHAWTAEPFGIEGNSWESKEYHVPEKTRCMLAEIDGKREIFRGIPINTNLCYGNQTVRNRLIDVITEYCINHKEVDYLHFWLADGYNNHCECELCKNTLPADFYIMILNQLDEKLKTAGLDTKIVFLIYQELLWEPQKEKLKNPERFVLMFAPISRTYSTAYSDLGIDIREDLPPYKRNKITLPRSVAANVTCLKKWQEKTGKCDSFIFEYHFMWDHFKDPGYMEIARVIFEDCRNLDKLGLNGMSQNQTQRAFFPNGLGVYLMGEALWNKKDNFEDLIDKYFTDTYGTDGRKVYKYLCALSKQFDPPYIRHEKPQKDLERAKSFSGIGETIESFSGIIKENIAKNGDLGIGRSWELLKFHAELCGILAKSFECKASGNGVAAETLFNDVVAFAHVHEIDLNDVFDVWLFIETMGNAVKQEGAYFN
ncbi:MAG: DUF4838 domain-containing protein [Spirochaetaceae bacterium]|jgi:hypothetical protein|nr:DUF4838 domain-containing protein [Spirochaetaceae bacterium]